MLLAEVVALFVTITLGLTLIGILLVIASITFGWYRPMLVGLFAAAGGTAGTIMVTMLTGVLSLTGAI